MQKIILSTAAFLFVSGTAFAGSDHYGSDYNYGSGHDYAMVGSSPASDHSSSVGLSGTASISTVNSAATVGGKSDFDIPAPGYGQGIWGNH